MPDDRPVHRCAVKACPVIGRWPIGGRCPLHQGAEYDLPVATLNFTQGKIQPESPELGVDR